MSSLTWKGVYMVNIDQTLSPAQLGWAQLCSAVHPQPGLCSVQAESASEVTHASITVQFMLGNEMEKNRTILVFVRATMKTTTKTAFLRKG